MKIQYKFWETIDNCSGTSQTYTTVGMC